MKLPGSKLMNNQFAAYLSRTVSFMSMESDAEVFRLELKTESKVVENQDLGQA